MNEFEIEFDAKTKEFEIETELAIQEVFPELENLEVTPSKLLLIFLVPLSIF